MIIIGIEIVLRYCVYVLNNGLTCLTPTDSFDIIPYRLTLIHLRTLLSTWSVWNGHFV